MGTLNVPASLVLALTLIWSAISIIAFIVTIVRVIIYNRRDKKPTGILIVFKLLTSYLNWSSANRLVTSAWFICLGGLILATPPAPKETVVSLMFIVGIVLINGMIIISDFTDYSRWLYIRKKVTSQYARDVDHGIQDALHRMGVYVDDSGNLAKKSNETDESKLT